ncbi:Skn-1-like basic-leucine zipper transcription factor [Mucor lusitanicus]|uniref:Skn-1-like basic-leucine zipper transcription factor n=2 Tax=Mucor circinelloides f. lusitanicus TaxID=29924 RepID=A0A168LYR9_MUCCL|nr:Skn-1-like basic-leucine zipper transcription factor [Mucor lusitanicus]OAD04134.1 Skn-1-like basic-leucine zipper transcription factor [Mucor lusitanicus CBS 277.49]
MNNNDNMNDLDPILSWILNSDTTEPNEKPVSDELLGYLLVDDQHQLQQHALSYPPILPNSQCSPPLPPQPQQQPSKLGKRKNGHSSPSEEDENDDPTEDQLKMMPSKERRQLRNKISARNFRNRRKEYMATLEERMDKCQAENSQLKLEVKWVRGMMDKLQAENDQLRLELALCKGGISQAPPASTVSPPTTTSSSNPLDWDIVCAPAAAAPITTTTVTSPTTLSSTSSSYPTHLSSTSTASNPNIYLAHATVPNWDLSQLLRKPHSSSVDLIRNYPLLAPALMSIVIQHTMTMTTDDIISNSTMTDPTMPHPPAPFMAPPNSHQDKFVAAVSDSALWHTIINAKPNAETPAVETQEQNDDQKLKLTEMKAYMQDHCPLRWIQKQFCMFVLFYVVVQYPRLDKPCRTYLPICDKFRIKRLASK